MKPVKQYDGISEGEWIMLCSRERELIIEITNVRTSYLNPGLAFDVHGPSLIPTRLWDQLCVGPEFEVQGIFSSHTVTVTVLLAQHDKL